jgi:hypothetical protein
VEEFTGHTCTYCPAGAKILKTIMDEDSTIIATAIHCTGLADPTSNPIYTNNYKTPMGDIICDNFNISGLPKAMINRTKNDAGAWGIDRLRWRSEIAKIDRDNICAGIELFCTVDENNQTIEAKVGVTIIKTIHNPVQICLVLQQDSIISGQKDGSLDIPDYVHNHVLRAGFTGNYGSKLTSNGIVNEQFKYSTTFRINYSNGFLYGTNVPVEVKNCSVVAYLIDMETKEVLQVEYVHLH